jgi:hypothetical protein
MSVSPFFRSLSAAVRHASVPDALGLALVRVAGDDARFLRALRRMAWEYYLVAATSGARDEAGLKRWWAEQLDAPHGTDR